MRTFVATVLALIALMGGWLISAGDRRPGPDHLRLDSSFRECRQTLRLWNRTVWHRLGSPLTKDRVLKALKIVS
jgi:hypothetical protein